MRKITLIVTLVALSQLTGCVAHRYYTDAPAPSYNSYNQPYPVQYQDRAVYPPPQQAQAAAETYRPDYQVNDQAAQGNFAQVIDIRRISVSTRSNGGGALIGAIIGGIIGNQLGRNEGHGASRGYGYRHGHGRNYGYNDNRDAATLGGAIVGGVIGNEVDRTSTEQRIRTEITLRYSDGHTQTLPVDYPGNFRLGDWVRVGFQSGRWVIF